MNKTDVVPALRVTKKLLTAVGRRLYSGGGGASTRTTCSCSLHPVSLGALWVEWNTCAVPGPVLNLR